MPDALVPGGVQLSDDGLVVVVGGYAVNIDLSNDELRHLAVHLALLADKRDGIEPPPEIAMRLIRPEGRA